MNLRTLDLNLLRVFDAIYGSRSVNAAAGLLNMRQSSVSAALARLRDLSGDPLFVRSGPGVAPTPRADAMAGPIRAGLAGLGQALNEAAPFDPARMTRAFTVTMHESAEPLATRGLLTAINRQAPDVILHTRIPEETGVASLLFSGEIDAAIDTTPIETPQINCLPLFRVRLVCAARPGWTERNGPLTRERFGEAGFTALKSRLRTQDIADRALAQRMGHRHIRLETASYWNMASLVAGSELLAVLPKIFMDEIQDLLGLEQLPLPYDLPGDVGYLIWHERHTDVPEHQWLRQSIQAAFGDSSEGVQP